MKLQTYLRKDVKKSLKRLREKIIQTEKALPLLEGFNPERANYTVFLYSLWESQGEKSTTTRHKGSLEGAIRAAEEEFKGVNHNRRDVQADYSVSVIVGKLNLLVPPEYWSQYKQKKAY